MNQWTVDEKISWKTVNVIDLREKKEKSICLCKTLSFLDKKISIN